MRWWIVGRTPGPYLIFGLNWNPQSQEKFFSEDGPLIILEFGLIPPFHQLKEI